MLKPHADERMTRALLTDGERDALLGDEDMDDSVRSSHKSRVKRKLRDRMYDDARILRTHAPELYDVLHDAVCEEQIDERVDRLEEEVEQLRSQLEERE